MEPVEIDGSFGEGGGQILRTSLALSALLKHPFKIKNIRAGRKKQGLAPQHLECVNALTKICNAKTEGVFLGSTSIYFEPHSFPPPFSIFSFSIPTAGSVSLLFQAVYMVLLFGGGAELTLSGGTHVAWSPPFEHLRWGFVPLLFRFGVDVDVELQRAGFFPHGGGIIRAVLPSAEKLKGVQLTSRKKVKSLICRIVLSRLPEHIARRQEETLRKALPQYNLRFVHLRPPSASPGNCVSIEVVAENCHAVFSSLGKKGKPAEEVAREVASDVERFLTTSATLDAHLADQILLPAALAFGKTVFLTPQITTHMETNIYVVRSFLNSNIAIRKKATSVEVMVEGCGYRPDS